MHGMRLLIDCRALLKATLFCAPVLGLLSSPIFAEETPFTWGAQIHVGEKIIEIPAVAVSSRAINCLATLPPNPSAKAGTLICRIGGNWQSKRVGPAVPPLVDDPDCVLLIDLESGKFTRIAGLQPAPNFGARSPDGCHFALASGVGWSPHENTADKLINPSNPNEKLSISPATTGEAARKLKSMLAGTVLYTIWDSELLEPIWEMRYPSRISQASPPQFFRPRDRSGLLDLPWWAIDTSPVVYNDPQIAFSPTGEYFVGLDDTGGLTILNLKSGVQRCVFQNGQSTRAITFYFTTDTTIAVLVSDGTTRLVRLCNSDSLGTEEIAANPLQLPVISSGTTLYPLFSADRSRQGIATVEGNSLLLRAMYGSSNTTISPISLLTGEMPVGIPRWEISPDGRWAGIGVETSKPQTEAFRFTDSGNVQRFERIDLKSAKVIERVATEPPEKMDTVPTKLVTALNGSFSFDACLCPMGERIIYALAVPRKQ